MIMAGAPSSVFKNAKKTTVIPGAHSSWSAAVLASTARVEVGASGYTYLSSNYRARVVHGSVFFKWVGLVCLVQTCGSRTQHVLQVALQGHWLAHALGLAACLASMRASAKCSPPCTTGAQ